MPVSSFVGRQTCLQPPFQAALFEPYRKLRFTLLFSHEPAGPNGCLLAVTPTKNNSSQSPQSLPVNTPNIAQAVMLRNGDVPARIGKYVAHGRAPFQRLAEARVPPDC